MTRVIVWPRAIERMREQMRLTPNTETGGVLVGRWNQRGDIDVADASGPGPRARLRRFSVLIDGVFAAKFCAEARRDSGCEMDYVGDWHCHLACSYEASRPDYTAMETMADFDGLATKTPISLIWAKYRNQFATYLFTEDRVLKRIPRQVSKTEPEGTA